MKHIPWKCSEESYHEYLQRAQRESVPLDDPRFAAVAGLPYAEAVRSVTAAPALPTDSEERKKLPVATGVVDYFPLAFTAIAELSRIGNDKHNPGMPLHWSRGKSDDHPDCLMRHFIERGKVDVNGVRHSTQVAWRALAILQLELEKAAIDAMEENAWRLKQPAEHPDDVLRRWGPRWRQGDAVRARRWPDIPEEAVGLPCDVEHP